MDAKVALVTAASQGLGAACARELAGRGYRVALLARSERVLALEYRADFGEGANNMPSLHVTFAWLVVLACRRLGPRAAGAGLPLVATAISASTLLVKMHILADVVAGAALAPASWAAAGRLLPRLVPPGSPAAAGPGLLARRAALPAILGVVLMAALRAAVEAVRR